jgi:CRP-like cAMP-binding protein
MFGQVPRQVIDMLRAIPVLSGSSTTELRAIAGLGTPIRVQEGRTLTTQGDRGAEFFVVRWGRASCTIDGEKVGDFGAGDFFGELALLSGTRRSATVTAQSEMELLVFSAAEFGRLLEASPPLAAQMRKRLGERVRVLEGASAR